MLSFGYCDQIDPDCILVLTALYQHQVSYCYHSVSFITFSQFQCDHIKRLPLYKKHRQRESGIAILELPLLYNNGSELLGNKYGDNFE
jgi:hypothetical protein